MSTAEHAENPVVQDKAEETKADATVASQVT